MATDWAADGINLAVAAGTGLLALASFSSIREACRSEADGLSHRVIVQELVLSDRPFAQPEIRQDSPNRADRRRGTPWPADEYDTDLLGLSAQLTLHNEGQTSALVQLDAPDLSTDGSGLACFTYTAETWRQGWLVVEPSSHIALRFAWWHTMRTWTDVITDELPLNVRLTARGPLSHEPVDVCWMGFWASPLVKRGDEWFISHWATGGLGDDEWSTNGWGTSIGPIERSYGSRFKRRRRFRGTVG